MTFLSSTVSIGDSTKKSHFDQLLDNTQYNKGRLDTVYSGTNTFVGIKTFSGAVNLNGTVSVVNFLTSTFSIRPQLPGIDSNTSTSGVSIQVGYDISGTVSLKRLYTKIIEIGDWNMDANTNKDVTHGLEKSKIRRTSYIIRDDNDTFMYAVVYVDGVGVSLLGITYINATVIRLTRVLNSTFDSIDFDSTTYNRGWVTIEYEA